MKIYVVGSSKNNFLPLDDIREKFIVDEKHEGDNIDFLNPWYCELTGLYYLWKHVDDDIVGLEHYRRYFADNNKHIYNKDEIESILNTHDIILNKYITNDYGHSYKWNLKQNRMPEFKKLFIIIENFYGKELADYCLKYQRDTDYCYEGNMFIAPKSIMNEYFDFLFTILDAYCKGEKYFNHELHPRVCGYLSEYIFGAWCEFKKFKIFNARRVLFNKNLSNDGTLGK